MVTKHALNCILELVSLFFSFFPSGRDVTYGMVLYGSVHQRKRRQFWHTAMCKDSYSDHKSTFKLTYECVLQMSEVILWKHCQWKILIANIMCLHSFSAAHISLGIHEELQKKMCISILRLTHTEIKMGCQSRKICKYSRTRKHSLPKGIRKAAQIIAKWSQ